MNPALRALVSAVHKKLLLQEADASGLGKGLPSTPDERARAFLNRVKSKRAICTILSQKDLETQYRMMKPRYVRGDLYHIAELQWRCPRDASPKAITCRGRALDYANQHWRPHLASFKKPEDLYWLGEIAKAAGRLTYVEYIFHVDPKGRSTASPPVTRAVTALQAGQAAYSAGIDGAKIHLLMDHRPPINKGLDDPKTQAEVRDELCRRRVRAEQRQYVNDLVRSARLQLYKDRFPPKWRPPAHIPDVGPARVLLGGAK